MYGLTSKRRRMDALLRCFLVFHYCCSFIILLTQACVCVFFNMIKLNLVSMVRAVCQLCNYI